MEGSKQFNKQEDEKFNMIRKTKCVKIHNHKMRIFVVCCIYVEIYALLGGPNGPKICGQGTKLI